MKLRCVFLGALALNFAALLFAEDDPMFAPYVTGLKATARGGQVSLVWTDSESARGPVTVYRAQSDFTKSAEMPQDAVPVQVVPWGLSAYVDTPPAQGTWHYFAAASDEDEVRFDLFLADVNTVEVASAAPTAPAQPKPAGSSSGGMGVVSSFMSQTPATAAPQPSPASPLLQTAPQSYQSEASSQYPQYGQLTPHITKSASPVQTAPQYQTPPPMVPGISMTNASLPVPQGGMSVLDLTAQGLENNVLVTFRILDPNKTPILYRSFSPIRQYADLASASFAYAVTSPYVDTPPVGVPCYYALVFEEDIRAGSVTFVPGANVTTKSAQVAALPFPSPRLPSYGDPVNGLADTIMPQASPPAASAASAYTPYIQEQSAIQVLPQTQASSVYTQPSTAYTNPLYTQPQYSGSNYYQNTPLYGNNSYQTPPPYGNNSYLSSPLYGSGSYQSTPAYPGSAYASSPQYSSDSLYGAVPTANYASGSPYGASAPYFSAASTVPKIVTQSAFSQDMGAALVPGEDANLGAIVQGAFRAKNWPAARSQLLQFLATVNGGAAEARARFYLGQCYYFSGEYASALEQFQIIKGRFPRESADWASAAISRMGSR